MAVVFLFEQEEKFTNEKRTQCTDAAACRCEKLGIYRLDFET